MLWIGGPPASGKSSIGDCLARRHGLRRYSADTRTWVHRDRALAEGVAAALRFEALSPTERWEQSGDDLVGMSLHTERGPMILDDVRALPPTPMILAEGTPLPASAVAAGDLPREHAVWLLPTAEFQERQLGERATPDGQGRLYRRLREVIERDALAAGVAFEVVDGSRTLEEVTAAVEARFAPLLAGAQLAATGAARRPLLREANLAVVGQVRGFHERPWAEGDPEAVVRDFGCECGERSCAAVVTTTVGRAAVAPVLAEGHHP